MTFLTPLLLLKTVGIVGTWVPSLPASSLQPAERGLSIAFAPNGTMRLKSASVTANGTYRVKGDTVTIVLARRNGVKPNNSKERQGTLRIAEGGKALLVPSGHWQKGMEVLLRLVRKR